MGALIASVLWAQSGSSKAIQPESWELVTLANQSRAAAGAGALQWDAALAEAARQHCLRMAAEGPIAHRYNGEADLTTRAGEAGAHFSLIEENVAVGTTPAEIHDAWMHSPGHRTNLLNAEVDHVGVAVVASRGVLYAVADYERAVPTLSQQQVEATVARLLRAQGLTVVAENQDARAYCASTNGAKATSFARMPGFMMVWQNSDPAHLPPQFASRLAGRQYRSAAVGTCAAQQVEGAFTAYRVAVLLY
jgi:hypothetical protein